MIIIVATICFAVVYVPKETNALVEKMNQMSMFARASYTTVGAETWDAGTLLVLTSGRHHVVILQRSTKKHVIICGDLSSTPLHILFDELFHEDHDCESLDAVILQPNAPNMEALQLLQDPIRSLRLTYLEGTPLRAKDLSRAGAEHASAILLITNKFARQPDEEDAKLILQLFAVRRYLALSPVAVKPFCISQLIKAENKRHVDGDMTPDEVVICLNEVKMGILAKNCLFPGTQKCSPSLSFGAFWCMMLLLSYTI